jgi:transposase
MMGRQTVDQSQLFYLFNLEARIPAHHLLRRINPTVTRILAGLREKLEAFYSEIGRPSIDPELMIRMLIVGYCYGIRSERRLCEEVELHLAYRWFCRLDLDDKVPDHSTFSVNRHGRFRDSDIFRHVFEAVVRACMVGTRAPNTRGRRVLEWSGRRRSQRRSQAAQGDLADGPVLGMDREGQQTGPVWLRAQLSDRH